MAQHDIGSLVVMDHGALAGMLTFREVLERSRSATARSATSKISDDLRARSAHRDAGDST